MGFWVCLFFKWRPEEDEGYLGGGDRAAGALGTPCPSELCGGVSGFLQHLCSEGSGSSQERSWGRVLRRDSHERDGQQDWGLGSYGELWDQGSYEVWGAGGLWDQGSCGARGAMGPGELWDQAPRAAPAPPGRPSPAFPSGREAAERPLPTRTIPLECEASARAAGGPPTGCSSGLWLSQMSLFSYSSLLEPQFKEWLRWNKIVLGNKVNTLRTFMHLLRPQKAAWTMVIKFAVRVKSWPSLLGMGFSCRHSSLGIYLAWGIIYLASRNLCTVVMNLCFEDAGFRAAVGQCSLPGPIFHYCVLPAHSQEPNY